MWTIGCSAVWSGHWENYLGKHLGNFCKAADGALCHPATLVLSAYPGEWSAWVHEETWTAPSPSLSPATLHSTPAAAGPASYPPLSPHPAPHTYWPSWRSSRLKGPERGRSFSIWTSVCRSLRPGAATWSSSALHFVSAAFLLVRRASFLPG